MKNVKFEITGEMRPLAHGLVDYIASGFIWRDGEKIPCEIGFTEFDIGLNPTYIFIKAGVTASGHHYEDETIEL